MTIFLLIIAVLVFWAILIFNRLIRCKNLMSEAFSGVDVQLKRRHDLIPNLVDAAKGYMQFERALLENITKLRGQAASSQDLNNRQQIENNLSKAMKSLFAVVESYPDLKANQNIMLLQNNLVEIEDQLQMARRYYNGTIRDYNILVQSFPSNVIAGAGNFKPAAYFQIEYATERQTPDVAF